MSQPLYVFLQSDRPSPVRQTQRELSRGGSGGGSVGSSRLGRLSHKLSFFFHMEIKETLQEFELRHMEVIVDPLGDRVRSRAPPGVTATSATATSRKRAGEIAMGSPSLTCPLLRPLPRTPSHGTAPSASDFPVGAPGLCASAAVTPRARVPRAPAASSRDKATAIACCSPTAFWLLRTAYRRPPSTTLTDLVCGRSVT